MCYRTSTSSHFFISKVMCFIYFTGQFVFPKDGRTNIYTSSHMIFLQWDWQSSTAEWESIFSPHESGQGLMTDSDQSAKRSDTM